MSNERKVMKTGGSFPDLPTIKVKSKSEMQVGV